jgi:hypothetical protein
MKVSGSAPSANRSSSKTAIEVNAIEGERLFPAIKV